MRQPCGPRGKLGVSEGLPDKGHPPRRAARPPLAREGLTTLVTQAAAGSVSARSGTFAGRPNAPQLPWEVSPWEEGRGRGIWGGGGMRRFCTWGAPGRAHGEDHA